MKLHHVLSLIFPITLVGVGGQRFQNPVLDGADYPDPGVIFYEGLYYSTTSTNNNKSEKYPIHSSKDLQNWEFVGYIFNASNFPAWTPGYDSPFWAAEIHIFQGKFNVYYSAMDNKTNAIAIGLAVADKITGPYIPQAEPFLSVGNNVYVLDSTVIRHNDALMLAWVETMKIRVRNLTEDGTAFKDNITVPIFGPDSDGRAGWADQTNEGPWYLWREPYHYMFYSGNNYCSDTYALGVARSSDINGSWEKLRYPILVSDDKFKGPGHGSIVQDTDGEGHVFVHHAWRAGKVCGDNPRLMFSSSLHWGDDNWPMNMTIGG